MVPLPRGLVCRGLSHTPRIEFFSDTVAYEMMERCISSLKQPHQQYPINGVNGSHIGHRRSSSHEWHRELFSMLTTTTTTPHELSLDMRRQHRKVRLLSRRKANNEENRC